MQHRGSVQSRYTRLLLDLVLCWQSRHDSFTGLSILSRSRSLSLSLSRAIARSGSLGHSQLGRAPVLSGGARTAAAPAPSLRCLVCLPVCLSVSLSVFSCVCRPVALRISSALRWRKQAKPPPPPGAGLGACQVGCWWALRVCTAGHRRRSRASAAPRAALAIEAACAHARPSPVRARSVAPVHRPGRQRHLLATTPGGAALRVH